MVGDNRYHRLRTLSGRLDPAVLAAAASFPAQNGKIGLELDGDRLAEALLEANPELGSTARDAEIVLRDGRPAVIPSRVGRGIDTGNLGAKITAALDNGKRTVSVAMRETQPDLTTREAEDLGVDEIVPWQAARCVVVARQLESTEAELMQTVFAHPTLSEMMHESVLSAYGRAIHF